MAKQLVWFKCKHLMTVMLNKIVDDIKPNMRMTELQHYFVFCCQEEERNLEMN